MPLNPNRRCSDCRNNSGYSSSSTSSSSTSILSDSGPLIVSSSMLTHKTGSATKAKVHRASSSSSSSSGSVSTAATSTSGENTPASLIPGPQTSRPERQDAFAWQLPHQSRHIPRARSHMQTQGPHEDPYVSPHIAHEDRMGNNTAGSGPQWGQGPGLQRSTTDETRMRNRNLQSRAHSSMPPRPAIPRSYGPIPYPVYPPSLVPFPQDHYGTMPDEGTLATWRRYNEPETLDSIRLQAIFAEWERQILLGLIPELKDNKHLWSSFVKRFRPEPPVLNMNVEVQKHTERLERESAENLKAAARRSKKSLDELARIDKSRKAYHGNPNIRAPKPKHPMPVSGVPKPRL